MTYNLDLVYYNHIIFVGYYFNTLFFFFVFSLFNLYNFMTNNNWNLGALISSLLEFSYLFESTKN